MIHRLHHLPNPHGVGFLLESGCLEATGAHCSDPEVAVFGFAEWHKPSISFMKKQICVYVFMVTSSMSSGIESKGGILLSSKGGSKEGGTGAAEGKGRGKETAPSTEDSLFASLQR